MLLTVTVYSPKAAVSPTLRYPSSPNGSPVMGQKPSPCWPAGWAGNDDHADHSEYDPPNLSLVSVALMIA